MAKLFNIQDYAKDGDAIILFCCKGGKEFEIKFIADKFMDWLRETDRLTTQLNEFSGGEHIGYLDSIMSDDEYWGLAEKYIMQDLYEYVILRLVSTHELFEGTEKALHNIANQYKQAI